MPLYIAVKPVSTQYSCHLSHGFGSIGEYPEYGEQHQYCTIKHNHNLKKPEIKIY